MIRCFTGWDHREAAGWHAFAQSVIERTSLPVALIPLTMNMQRDGTNAFTYSRFLIPSLCNYEGFALFLDASDMMVLGDLAELWEERDGWHAVKVVKHDYQPKHERKYVGTDMEAPNAAYPRKNWSSLVLWNCGHYVHKGLTPEFVASKDGSYLHRFGWIPDDRIGDLPKEWNWLDEYGAHTGAKVLHYTNGIPGFYQYRDAPHADEWRGFVRRAQRGLEA